MMGKHSPRRLVFVFALMLAGCAAHSPPAVYQTSTITALLEGVYEDTFTIGELRNHGDFGIGTLNEADGEMIALDGRFYQIRSDGRAYLKNDRTLTPFATVTFFRPDHMIEWDHPLTFDALKSKLDEMRSTANVPYAIRIDGQFDLVRTRSVPRQTPPYPRLVDVVKQQPTFDFPQTTGTIIAFYIPQYMDSLNVPGYHFHYLTADATAGGHVLDCQPRHVRIQIEELSSLSLRLPQTKAFRSANLTQQHPNELHTVEMENNPTPHSPNKREP